MRTVVVLIAAAAVGYGLYRLLPDRRRREDWDPPEVEIVDDHVRFAEFMRAREHYMFSELLHYWFNGGKDKLCAS
jgi:hypothetical protein